MGLSLRSDVLDSFHEDVRDDGDSNEEVGKRDQISKSQGSIA